MSDTLMDTDIDLVCCWVQLDEDYQRQMFEYKKLASHGAAFIPNRFRDNGELIYSFRAAVHYMPWLRHIHIVTNGQLPPAEIYNHPKVKLVRHDQIFKNPSDLPTFSYHAIEANLHNIPGLSEYYINTNDDFFPAKPIARDFFHTQDGHPIFYLEGHTVPQSVVGDSVWDHNLFQSNLAISSIYDETIRYPFTHMPVLFRRSVAKAVWELWPEEVARTSASKFRATTDIVFRMLYTYHYLHGILGINDVHRLLTSREQLPQRNVKRPNHATYRFIPVGDSSSPWENRLAAVLSNPPDFFCLNDHIGSHEVEGVQRKLGAFFKCFDDLRYSTVNGEFPLFPPELRAEFDDLESFRTFAEERHISDPAWPEQLVDEVCKQGIRVPMFDEVVEPFALQIASRNYRETLTHDGLNSRRRAVLYELHDVVKDRPERTVRIFAPEAFSAFALKLRGRFPRFLGTATYQEAIGDADLFPITEEKLDHMSFPDECFDVALLSDVLEYVSNLPATLSELARILAPSGVIIATFRFRLTTYETATKAVMRDGLIIDPGSGKEITASNEQIIYRVPAWDILDHCREAGFRNAMMVFHASQQFGIIGAGPAGIMILKATR